jgi:hypothetical protein
VWLSGGGDFWVEGNKKGMERGEKKPDDVKKEKNNPQMKAELLGGMMGEKITNKCRILSSYSKCLSLVFTFFSPFSLPLPLVWFGVCLFVFLPLSLFFPASPALFFFFLSLSFL